jgi:hypothetical protein
MSLRFLTLLGLGVHGTPDDDDAVAPVQSFGAPASNGGAVSVSHIPSKGVGVDFSKATALLWAFHFPRCEPAPLATVFTALLSSEFLSLSVPAIVYACS